MLGLYISQILRYTIYTILRTKPNKSADLESILDPNQELDQNYIEILFRAAQICQLFQFIYKFQPAFSYSKCSYDIDFYMLKINFVFGKGTWGEILSLSATPWIKVVVRWGWSFPSGDKG